MPKVKQWDKMFKQSGKIFIKVHEDMPKLVKIFKKHKVEKILDLGNKLASAPFTHSRPEEDLYIIAKKLNYEKTS